MEGIIVTACIVGSALAIALVWWFIIRGGQAAARALRYMDEAERQRAEILQALRDLRGVSRPSGRDRPPAP